MQVDDIDRQGAGIDVDVATVVAPRRPELKVGGAQDAPGHRDAVAGRDDAVTLEADHGVAGDRAEPHAVPHRVGVRAETVLTEGDAGVDDLTAEVIDVIDIDTVVAGFNAAVVDNAPGEVDPDIDIDAIILNNDPTVVDDIAQGGCA